jgi:hypothetical protein
LMIKDKKIKKLWYNSGSKKSKERQC